MLISFPFLLLLLVFFLFFFLLIGAQDLMVPRVAVQLQVTGEVLQNLSKGNRLVIILYK